MLFQDSVTRYRSVYFHFLDGLLNTTSGGSFRDVISTLNDLTPELLPTDITFAELSYEESTSSEIISTLSFNFTKLIFNHNSEDTIEITPDLFKFCIIPIGYNDHQTTTIIFTKKNIMYLYILNTGLDIHANGKEEIINNQNMDQLTKGIIICNNTTIKDELEKAYKFMKNFFLISYVYNYINKKDNYINKKDFFIKINIKDTWNHKYIFSEKFKFVLNILYLSEKKSIFNNIFNNIFKFNNTNINLDYINKNLDSQYDEIFHIKIDKNYYILVSNFIDQYQEIKIGTFVDITNYNNSIISKLKINGILSDNFIKKVILYNYNNNLYISSQESGSCVWFSTYFSILLYYVIHDSQQNYINFINQINIKFYEYISSVYTKDNFINELKDRNNYIYMKQLCSKLIDIKLIDNSILYDNLDLLYETEFSLDLTNNQLPYSYILEANLTDDLPKDNEMIMLNLFLSLSNFNLKNFYINAYKIFRYRKDKNSFFKQEINLEEIIEKIKLGSYYEKNNIINLLKILNHTNIIQLNEKIPSYITYYIPIILYINSNFNPQLNLNFDNKEELFKCCLLFFRLHIFIHIISVICYSIFKKSNNPSLLNILYELIDNLINKSKNFIDYDSQITDDLFSKYRRSIIDNHLDIYKIFYCGFGVDISNFIMFDDFEEKFDILTDIEYFAFNNKTFITKEFLTYNISRIDEDKKKDLIEFYLNILYNYKESLLHSDEEIKDEIKYAVINLYILLFGCPSKETEGEYFLVIKYYTLKLIDFVKKIEKLKNETDFNGFKDKIINQKNKIFKDEFMIIPKYNYEETKVDELKFTTKFINNGIFHSYNNSQTNLLVQKDIKVNYNFDIYQIINNNYIRYNCISIENDMKFTFKILEIYVNGNKVLKFKDIIYPFKYLIPNTDIILIYEENGVYNIACNFYLSSWKNSLLGVNNLKKDHFIYQINPNNQFFLNKFSSNSNFENWNSLCLNYQLNSYNILYINFKDTKTDTNGYSCTHKRYSDIFNFDKNIILKECIDNKLTGFKLLNTKPDTHLLEFNIDSKIKDKTESYKKLLFKISKCKINQDNKQEWITKFNKIKEKLEEKIKRFTDYIKNLTLGDLLNNYLLLQSYLLNIKILNFIEKILANINNQDNFCSIIKNYNYLFDTKQTAYTYKFEILFELINGNEILNEQMKRYQNMIYSFYKYKEINQTGNGVPANIRESTFVHNSQPVELLKYNDDLIENEKNLIDIKMDLQYNEQPLELCKSANYYPLHHFMMGKGKSAIITPLLSLHLNIIKEQNIYIIVPKHLVKQTNATLKDYLDIFQIKNILIKSEDDIKKEFLEGKFVSIKKTVFLIDEFDSLLNPLKSNFNYIQENNFSTDNMFNIDDIRSVIKKIIDLEIFKQDELLTEIKKYETIINPELLADNILSIIEQLKNEEIKFNIDWGIDYDELFAVPFRSKDKPIKNSSFTSIIKTLFLSYYYYIKIKEYQIDDNIFNYIKYNYKIFKSFFSKSFDELTVNFVNDYLKKNQEIKNNFFNLLFKEIFIKIKLPKEQYNTSFIDIINIDNIFKIGYSGTLNLNLPEIQNTFKFDQECIYPDEDESNNIEHAILNSDIYDIDKLSSFTSDFNALIDVCGYYYNSSNYKIALNLHVRFTTNIIFIDEKDEKMVIRENGTLEKLNENIVYKNPFFYYDQAHIVGIDIKQDNYPILHGLCIVDNLSYYSEVAQAMFRLRKLNLGHRISFILNKFSLSSQQELLQKFRQNEKNLIEQYKNNLNLQAFKSDIRKKRTDDKFIERYKETLFYYFREDLNKNPLKIIFINLDISEKNLEPYKLNLDKVRKIIFDLDFKSTGIQHQVISKQNIQVQTQMQTQMQNQLLIQKSTNVNEDIYEKFEKYLFKNFDLIKNIKTEDDYNKATFKIDELISFLPNIFFDNHSDNTSCFKYNKRNSNRSFLFVYIHTIQKFILIPIFMVVYLYNDFLMFDLNFNIINDKLIGHLNPTKKKELEENTYVKIITNNYTSEEINCYYTEFENSRAPHQSYIFSFLISYYLLTLFGVINVLNRLWDRSPENLLKYMYVNKAYNRIRNKGLLDDLIKIQNINFTKYDHLIRNELKIDDAATKKKYLKYKAKYLNLKKNFK